MASRKILHLVGQLMPGGTERQLLYVAEALKARGWTQTVVTLNRGCLWDDRVARVGLPLLDVPNHRVKVWRLYHLARLVRREGPDIIHSWAGYTNVYARWLVRFPRRRKVFSLRADLTTDQTTGRPMARSPYVSALDSAAWVVSNSADAVAKARAQGARLHRAVVLPNIVKAHGRANPGEAVAAPRIVAAGRLIPLKGYDVLLEALGALTSRGRSFELLVAGIGPERSRLEAMAEQLGIASRVQFLGAVEDVPALIATCHILVHPSRSEALSNTILEGMAEGVPVVATAVGAAPEVVEQGKTGYLIPPGSPDELAAAIEPLLLDPGLRARIGGAALESVRSRYSEPVIIAGYERVYQAVLAS